MVPLPRIAVLAAVVAFAVIGCGGADTQSRSSGDEVWPTDARPVDCREVNSDGRTTCAIPSPVMTSSGVADLAAARCPSLVRVPAREVVAQPLGVNAAEGMMAVAATGFAGAKDRALLVPVDPADPDAYQERVLLGTETSHAYLSRWVGGENHGLLEIGCSGGDGWSLSLRGDQVRSTLAALSGASGIDFIDVAAQTASVPTSSVPVTMSCDTAGIDLSSLEPGGRFTCGFVVAPQRVEFQTTAEAPYFQQVGVVPGDSPAEPQPDLELEPEPEPAETPTVPASSSGPPTCATVADIKLGPGPQCDQALVVVSQCDAVTPLTMLYDTGGLASWSYRDRDGQERRPFTSAPDGAASVLSCGTGDGGLDVEELHGAVWKAAQDGWGIAVSSVACAATGRGPLDTAPPGPARASCTVTDEDGFPAFAQVSVTETPPYFTVELAE